MTSLLRHLIHKLDRWCDRRIAAQQAPRATSPDDVPTEGRNWGEA